jgi:hypothetical protein
MCSPRQDSQFRQRRARLGLGGVPFRALGMYSPLGPQGKTESVAPFAGLCGGICAGGAEEYEKRALG